MNSAMGITPPGTPIGNNGEGQHPAAEDLVLFAMQLLQDEEAEAVEKHTHDCSACREELGRVYGDLAALALTTERVAAPGNARDRLLAEIAGRKAGAAASKPVLHKRAPLRPVEETKRPEPSTLRETVPSLAEFGRATSTPIVDPISITGSRSNIYVWAGWAVAAAMAVISGLLYSDHRRLAEQAAAQSSTIERMNTLAQNSRQLMDALTDPQATRVTLAPRAPAHTPEAGVTYNPKKGTLILLASNLDPLQTYKTYELWVIPANGAPIPAGMFHPDEHGNASVILPNLPKGVKAKSFGVTIEDSGGAEKPTMPIVMAGS